MCRTFERFCRERGIRLTAQRLAVYQMLASDEAHPTADLLYARLKTVLTSLSQATVYRILDSFEREGVVRKVSATDGAARYDVNQVKHQHLVCRSCGSIMDLEDQSLAQLPLPRLDNEGFLAEEFDVRIIGRCRACRQESAVQH